MTLFDANSIAVAIHVALAGLWIGADLGTFLSYRRVIDPSLEVSTRKEMARYFALIDMGPPLALTSDKSTECYRHWWPGPGDAMVALMNRSIDLMEAHAERSGNRFLMSRRGYVFATAR